MKVLHLGKYYFPSKGGIEIATKYSAETEVEKYNPVVNCFGNFTESIKISDVRVNRYRSIKFFNQPFSIKYISNSVRLISENDIIHLHWPNYLAGLICLKLNPKKKLILHWHAAIDKIHTKFYLFPLKLLEKILVDRADKIIVATNSYAKGSKSLINLSESKLVILPYPHEEPLRSPKFEEKENLIVSIGRLVPYKGILEQVRYIRLPDGWKWIIIGQGIEFQKIKNLIKERRLSDKIILCKDLDDKEKNKILNKSKIFLFPSLTRQESYGIAQVEALSYGLTIINFEIPGSGVSEIIPKTTGSSLKLYDYEGINKLLLKYSENEKCLEQNFKAALRVFQSKYTLTRYKSHLIEKVYTEKID